MSTAPTPVSASLPGRIVPEDAGAKLDVMGVAVETKLTAGDTGGLFNLFVVTAPPGAGVPMHVHDNEDESFYVLEGRLDLQLDGKPLAAGPGDTVFLPRRIPHAWFTAGQQTARFLFVSAPGTLDTYFPEIATPQGSAPPSIESVLAASERFGIRFV